MEGHDFSSKPLLSAFTYRLLRTFLKRQGGLRRFNITVSCELAALTTFLHCFLERDQGYLNLLRFLRQKLDFLRRGFMETNITQQKFKNFFICLTFARVSGNM